MTSSIYIPRGINVTSLNHDQTWPFQPSKLFKASTCNLKSCCQIYSFMSYSNPALLLALFFLLLLFSHHIYIFFLLLPLKSFQSTFLFRKWKEGKGKWKRVSLSSDVLFSILMHFLCTVNSFLTLFSCHCPFPRISFYHHFVLNSRLVATSQEEISLPQCRKTH